MVRLKLKSRQHMVTDYTKSKKYLIYALIDPITNMIRYVGKSAKGMKRPKEHFTPGALKKKSYRSSWIKSLKKNYDVRPDIEILESFEDNVDRYVINEAEIFWIGYLRYIGCPLTNLTDGGDGVSGWKSTRKGIPLSEETKRKIAKSARENSWNRGLRTLYGFECETCKLIFFTKRNQKRKNNFCSRDCYNVHPPWNKGLKLINGKRA